MDFQMNKGLILEDFSGYQRNAANRDYTVFHINVPSHRPPAQRVAWIFPPSAEKPKARQCLNRCGCNRVQSTRLKTPHYGIGV